MLLMKSRKQQPSHRAVLTKAEEFFGIENLTDPDNLTIQHHVNQAIKANGVMKLDVDYVVKDGEVIIVDEFTGRLMYGRRFNEGLHQPLRLKRRKGSERKQDSCYNHYSRTTSVFTKAFGYDRYCSDKSRKNSRKSTSLMLLKFLQTSLF